MANRDLENLFAAAHIDPNSFETKLALLCRDGIILIGLDNVIEGLDHMIEALEGRRDLETGLTPKPPVPEV